MIEFLIDLDIKLFNFFNSKISNPIFDLIFPVITDQDFWTMPILGLIIYLLIARGKVGKISVLLLLIAVGLSDFVSASILKPYFERLRPSHSELEGLILLVNKGGKYGFVSSHAANIFAASTILSFFYIHKKKLCLTIAFLVSYSRVYVGVHFPGDVIFGGMLGYLIAIITITFYSKFVLNKNRKKLIG